MDNQTLFIPILLGTAREGRESEKVAKYALKMAQEFGFESEIVDAKDHMLDKTVPGWQDPKPSEEWRKIMNRADGLVIVIPEYNHGYPGEFKIVFDQLSPEYNRKPVAVCSVSDGAFGGVRMIEMLWSVVISRQMIPLNFPVHFPFVDKLFDKDLNFIEADNDTKYARRMNKMFAEVEWYAKAMNQAKENLIIPE